MRNIGAWPLRPNPFAILRSSILTIGAFWSLSNIHANSHQFTVSSNPIRSNNQGVSGTIPGVGRGAILGAQGAAQGQQAQLGQQPGQQNQQLAQQLGQLMASATAAKSSSSRIAAERPLQIAAESAKFFDAASKANADAFKQLQQSFSQSQDKNKPNPDNTKITEGLAQDQQRLAEANAKAPPVGSAVVADLIKGLVEAGDTQVKMFAQLGLQMAPPPPGATPQASVKKKIADQLANLGSLLATTTTPRSTFSGGATLSGDNSSAIPVITNRRH